MSNRGLRTWRRRALGWHLATAVVARASNFYVVYKHNCLDDPVRSRFVTLDRRAAPKILYKYRF